MYPLFHEQLGTTDTPATILEINPFYGTYKVDRDQVESVRARLDARAQGGEPVTFVEFEGHYQESGLGPWHGSSLRVVLINVCRYLYLHGAWDEPFWQGLLADAPPEAQSIPRELDRFEIMPL